MHPPLAKLRPFLAALLLCAGSLSASQDREDYCLDEGRIPDWIRRQALGILRVERCGEESYPEQGPDLYLKTASGFKLHKRAPSLLKDLLPVSAFGYGCNLSAYNLKFALLSPVEGGYAEIATGPKVADRAWVSLDQLKGCAKGFRRRVILFNRLCPDSGFLIEPDPMRGKAKITLYREPSLEAKSLKMKPELMILLDQKDEWIKVLRQIDEGEGKYTSFKYWMPLRNREGLLQFWPEDPHENFPYDTGFGFNCHDHPR